MLSVTVSTIALGARYTANLSYQDAQSRADYKAWGRKRHWPSQWHSATGRLIRSKTVLTAAIVRSPNMDPHESQRYARICRNRRNNHPSSENDEPNRHLVDAWRQQIR